MNLPRPHSRALASALSSFVMTRRGFLSGSLAAFFASYLTGCSGSDDITGPAADAHLAARPGTPTETPVLGESTLGLEAGRDGLLYVPADYDPGTPAPLLVLLHGAGGAAADWRSTFARAGARGLVILALDSRGTTWDRVRGDFGADLAFMDTALLHTFNRCAIDANRILLAGFSDGASYALSLGVGNGDLFTHLGAFSPGFVNSGENLVGKPRIFVSHGTQDPVISVETSRQSVVPLLKGAGYDVRYEEFEGGHTVPAGVFDAALDWFLDERL
jgi:phospholipase/carboxylesterase